MCVFYMLTHIKYMFNTCVKYISKTCVLLNTGVKHIMLNTFYKTRLTYE